MSELFDSLGPILWRVTWQSALLALAVGVVISAFRERIAPRWQYALWSVVLLRLVLVITPSTPWSAFNLFAEAPAEFAANHETTEIIASADWHGVSVRPDGNEGVDFQPTPKSNKPTPTESATPIVHPEVVTSGIEEAFAEIASIPESAKGPGSLATATGSVRSMLIVLWCAGCFVFGLRYVGAWFGLRRRLAACQPVTDAWALRLLENAMKRTGVRFVRPRLLVTSEPTSPHVAGMLRPRIVLPESMLQTTGDDEIEFVLAHELAHLSRGDVWMQSAILAAQTLHWFNPFSWWTGRRLQATREAACDDFVVSRYNQASRSPYANAILAVSRHLQPPPLAAGVIGLFHRRSLVSDRVRRLADPVVRKPVREAISVGLVIALVVFGLTDASESASATPAIGAEPAVQTNGQDGKSDARQNDQRQPKQPPSVTSKSYVISGTCRDWDKVRNGQPDQTLADVTVKLISARGLRQSVEVLATTKTNAKGEFEFGPVEPPNYRRWDSLQYFFILTAL